MRLCSICNERPTQPGYLKHHKYLCSPCHWKRGVLNRPEVHERRKEYQRFFMRSRRNAKRIQEKAI